MSKTKLVFICLTILILFLAACTEPTPDHETTKDMIALGDTVGEMRFTRIDEYDGLFGLEIYCDDDNPEQIGQSVQEYACETVEGSRVFLNCLGAYADSTDELDKIWEDVTWSMTVDGQPVDLPSFGTVDMVAYWDSDVPIRSWSVVIENVSAGQHEIICNWADEDGQGEQHRMFTVLEAP
jgi:hypothetical protein